MSRNRLHLIGFLLVLGFASFADLSSASTCADLVGVSSVDEMTAVGHSIIKISAKTLTIVSSDDPSAMNYIEAVQNPDLSWSINVKQLLDAEALTSSYLLYKVSCQDTNGPRPLSYDFNLVVKDVNEFPPWFKKSPLIISLSESFEVGHVAFTINTNESKAVDNDTAHVECAYSLLPNDYFEITNSIEGYIVLTKKLDYDTGPKMFNLTIIAEELNALNKFNTTNSLLISITDDDDLNPVFNNQIYNLTLSEGDNYGNVSYNTIPVVSARDGDVSINTEINYRLDDSSHALYGSLFSFNTADGSMSVNGRLIPGKYIVNVRAYQKDNPELRYAIAIVNLIVTDINNHAPTMTQPQYLVNVSELFPTGLVLLVVTAYDEDLGDNAAMEFHLTDNTDGVFDIKTEQNHGSIILKKNLDYESKAVYTLQVYAQETKTKENLRSNGSIITITVVDENDNPPVFVSSSYTFNVNRTATSGSTIGMVRALDKDSGLNGQVTYTLQTTSAPLAINTTSGEITLTKSLSASDVGTFYATVMATDNGAEVFRRRSTQIPVLIKVLQVNDNSPVFSGPDPYIINIPETTAANNVVGQVKAVDPDGDIVQYSVQSGNTGAYLSINPSTGDIVLVQVNDLDSDSVPAPPVTLNIVVAASDGIHQATKTIKVNFLYVNEFGPVFPPKSQQNPVVNETATRGTYITTVTATDRDKGQDGNLTYSFLALASSPNFVIDSKSGVINLSCSTCLNYTKQRSYDLFVKVEDGGQPSRFALIDLTVDVIKTIGYPPRFSQKNYTFDVPEIPENQTLFTLEAFDPDSATLFYNVAPPHDPSESSYYINILTNGTVEIYNLDAERHSRIITGVSVTDGNYIDSALIILNVLDVNDNDPVLIMPSSINLPENFELGKSVLNVTATDSDISNAGFTFFLDSGANGKFQIDKSTGQIITNGQFDRRQKAAYNISIGVMDHGNPYRYVSKNLNVIITDSNVAPIFVSDLQNKKEVNEYTFKVTENTTIGSLVGTLLAYDPDSGSSGRFTFSIMDQGKVFLIERDDGALTLAKNLNYETTPSYNFPAVVTDNSLDPKSNTVSVKIVVLNIVEAPDWPLPLPIVYFTQTSSCSSQVKAFSREVTSLSSRGDEAVEYKLLNMTDSFLINSSTGLLENIKTLNPRTYVLGLAACSKGTDVCSNADLTVIVQSDDSLAFCPAFYDASVNESAPINTALKDLSTTKGDTDITYQIISGNSPQAFRIDANTGILYVNGPLDRENVAIYTLIVSASLANTPQTAEAQVIIMIIDEPDTPPEFLSQLYQGEVSESAQVGSAIRFLNSPVSLIVEAKDKDLNAKLSYSIEKASDTSNGCFQIDNTTGAITLAKNVDFELIPRALSGKYTFSVAVTDGYFIRSVNVTVNVIDANDNDPEFVDKNNIWLNVSEATQVPKTLFVVNATDADLLDEHSLVYSLSLVRSAGQGNPFRVDSATGELFLEDELDREKTAEYYLLISVRDSAGHTATKEVKITVLDVNDNRPEFTTNVYKMNVSEDEGLKLLVTPGSIIVGQTKSLMVNCSFSHIALDISHLTALVLYSSVGGGPFKEILSANSFSPERTAEYVDLHSAFIYETITDSAKRTSYLGLYWAYPHQPDTVYRCEASALTNTDQVVIYSKEIAVKNMGQVTTEYLLNELQIIGNQLFNFTDGNGGGHIRKENNKYREMMFFISEQYNGTKYYLYKYPCDGNAQTADEAAEVCKLIGGELTLFDNKKQYQFVQSFIKSKFTNETSVFISGHDDMKSDQWVSQNSYKPLTFYKWATNEPANYNIYGRHCIVMAWYAEGIRMRASSCVTDYQSDRTTFICSVPSTNGSRLNITAVDKDSEENAEITYIIISGDYKDNFAIIKEGNQAYLQLEKALDREDIFTRFGVSIFQIQITASDSNTNNDKPSTCTVTVDVQDVNDNRPVFSPTQYNATVKEDAKDGTVISLNKNLFTTDRDSDKYGTPTIEYSLIEDGESSNFDIDSSTGQIFLNFSGGHLDRETKNKYVLEVIATDDYGKGLKGSATVTVYIEDVNDEKPHFVKKDYKFSVPENSQLGTSVGDVYANDSDLVGGLTLYYIHGFMFSIDRLNGTIRVTGNLDRESKSEYNLMATACDSDQSVGCDDAAVTITILDLNDCCPVWNSTSLTLIFSESKIGLVGQVFALDDDLGPNGTVTYSINDTETQKYFNVTPQGDVYLLKSMESSSHILSFPVYAKDEAIPPCIQQGDVQVKVQGVNKFSPEIGYNGSWGVREIKLTVPTNARQGTVIGQVKKRDNDTGINGETYFFILGNASNFLNISDDGFITVLKENTISEEGTLWVTDKGIPTKNSSCSLQVTILTSPENPVFSNISYTFSVNETKNLVFIGTVTATVQGGGKPPQYSILTDGVPFRVEGSNGTIFSTSALDREKLDRFPFILSASNSDSSRTLASVIVQVLDVNDNSPLFEVSIITVTVQEGITKTNLVQLSASDADDGPNKIIIYHLLDKLEYFEIENQTGIVSVIAPLDRENVDSYILHIQAIDGGDPKLTSTATIHVEVTDANDNPPVFKQSSYAFNVTASKIVPQKLFSVNSTDSDLGVNQQFIYLLDDSEASKSFSIDPFTGQISTVKHLDLDLYSFVVKAHDLGTPTLTGNASIVINVRHEDIVPQLSISAAATTLFVGMTKGHYLNVSISSQDALKVSITDGNENQIFEIDNNNNLKLANDLTETRDYQLVLTAVSLSGVNTSKTVLVMVRNLEFNQTTYLAAVLENFKQVPKVICTLGSLAQSLKLPVLYSLDNYRGDEFKVDGVTGEFSVIKLLDRELTPVYVVNVSVSLRTSNQNRRKRQVNDKAGHASVVVQVIDVNDNPPSFGNRGSQFRLNVPADAKANDLITTLKAFDPDEGINSVILYKIIQGDTTTFKINSSTGELRVANPVGLKPQTELALTISATGINDPGHEDTLNITISVQSIYQFSLIASIPKSKFEENQKEILGNLSQILGYTIQLEAINVHKENGDVDTERSDLLLNAIDPKTNETIPISQIQSKIAEKQADITKLFDSYTKSNRVSSSNEDSFGVASIALLVVACVMFVVSLGAILVAYLLWKKQRHYAQKEESAAKVRQRMEEQLVQKKGTSLSSDPDEHLEMKEVQDFTEEQERTFVFETEFKNDISTLALRRHLVDVGMQKMQQLFQAAAGEDSEEPYQMLTNESNTDEHLVNSQTNHYAESPGPLLNGRRDTGIIYEEDETTDSSDDSSVFSSMQGLIKEERTSFSSEKGEAENQQTSDNTKTVTDNTGYVNSNVLPFLGDIKLRRKRGSNSSSSSSNSEVQMSSLPGFDQPDLQISNFYQSPPAQSSQTGNGYSLAKRDSVSDNDNSIYSFPIKLNMSSPKELQTPSPELVKQFFSEDPTITTIKQENSDNDETIEESTKF